MTRRLLAVTALAATVWAGAGTAQTVSPTQLAGQQRAEVRSVHSAHERATTDRQYAQEQARKERARKKAKKQVSPE